MNILLLSIPIALAFAHYCGIRWQLHSKTLSQKIQSLSAGLAVSYIFLVIIPENIADGEAYDFNSMILLVLGFSLFHIVFKMILQYSHEKQEKEFLLEELHLFASASYSFLVTLIIIDVVISDFIKGAALFIVILLHTILSDISNLGQSKKYSLKFKMISIIGATLLGGILGVTELLSDRTAAVTFSIAAGSVIYITMREELPIDSKGSPFFFVIGIISVIVVDQVFAI